MQAAGGDAWGKGYKAPQFESSGHASTAPLTREPRHPGQSSSSAPTNFGWKDAAPGHPYGRGLGMGQSWGQDGAKPGSRIFDEKVAALNDYQYNGREGGDAWRLKVRNYFIGRCPDILPLLRYVETLGEVPITDEDMKIQGRKFWPILYLRTGLNLAFP